MSDFRNIKKAFIETGWFHYQGCHTLFDGQYGSTGKGVLASLIGETMGDMIDTVTTNAGPNSGHTGFFRGEKIVTMQVPVASVVMSRRGIHHECYLNAGAVINPARLKTEWGMLDTHYARMLVHPHAAVIRPEHVGDHNNAIASTGKGVGPAMMGKLGRSKEAVVMAFGETQPQIDVNVGTMDATGLGSCFVETAQGWSLGINSGQYPYVTTRECGPTQALADLGVSPRDHVKSIVSLRTFPIRVGNTEGGWSGPFYEDSTEVSWEDLGVEAETTTVTGRVRRVATFSWIQYREMLRATQPDALFINFMNYLETEEERGAFINRLLRNYRAELGCAPDFILGGYGPLNSDVRLEFSNA